MFLHVMHLVAVITVTTAMPLSSHVFSGSTSRKRCHGTLALLEDGDKTAQPEDDYYDSVTEMPPVRVLLQPTEVPSDRFEMKHFKLDSCKSREEQPAVRLSAFPNSGTTWLQYLLEEATKVATQSPQYILRRNLGTSQLLPGQEVSCRAECGAQTYLHRNCTAGSIDANNVRLSFGATPEIFKNHYPDVSAQYALFETYNEVQKTILLARNPVDAYLAWNRHTGVMNPDKVGAIPGASISENCVTGFTSMRPETMGRGVDPLHIFEGTPLEVVNFEQFLVVWCTFYTFWLTDPFVGCTEVIVVRYEDLANTTVNVLETILQEAGFSTEGTSRAVMTHPVDDDRLSYDVYFNETLRANDTIKHWADTAVRECGDRVNDFGYTLFLQDVLKQR